MGGTGSGSCPMVCFGISGVEPSGSVLKSLLISKTYLGKAGCKGGTWMELAQDYNQWRAFVLVTLNHRVHQ
jgi:hypothetical protein